MPSWQSMIWKFHNFSLFDDLTTQSDKDSHEEFGKYNHYIIWLKFLPKAQKLGLKEKAVSEFLLEGAEYS